MALAKKKGKSFGGVYQGLVHLVRRHIAIPMRGRTAALFAHAILGHYPHPAKPPRAGRPLSPADAARAAGSGRDIAGKPSVARARLHRLNHAPSHVDQHGVRAFHGCCAPTGRFCPLACAGFDPCCERVISDFAEHGSGATVYFKFLKLLAWVLVLATLCAVPMLVINVNARAPLSSLRAITLSATTLGNLAVPLQNATVLQSLPGWSLVAPAGLAPSPDLLALIYAFCDVAGCLVFFAAYLWLRWGEEQEEQQVNRATITADDYTVFLPEVPPHATEEGLKAFFSQLVQQRAPRPLNHPPDFAVVEEVHVIEDDAELLKLLLARGKLRRKAERAAEALRDALEEQGRLARGEGEGSGGCCYAPTPQRILALHKAKAALDAQIAQASHAADAYKCSHERSPVAAFVTFRHQAAREWVVQEYAGGYLAWACQPRALRLPVQGQPPARSRLSVKAAPSPTAIIWKNLSVPAWNHCARVALTASLSLVVLGVSFLILWFASARVAAAQASEALAACATVTPLAPGSALAAALHAQPNAQNATKYCTCALEAWGARTLAQVTAPYAVSGQLDVTDCPYQACPRWLELDVAGVWKEPACVAWLQSRSYAAVLVAGASVLVLGINSVLGYIMRQLTIYEGHASWEDLNSSLALRLFFASFFNTGLLVVAINVDWPFVMAQEVFPSGKFADFTQEWFANVGTTILTTMLINIFSPHLYNALRGLCYCYYVSRDDLRAPTQRDLDRRVLGPPNDPAIRYAQLLNTVFVCLVFSTGMPLLLPIAAASTLLFFWVDKATFMWYFRKPAVFSYRLQQTMSALLPLALLLKLAVGAWMLSGSAFFAQVDVALLSAYSAPMAARLQALSTYPTLRRGVARVTAPGVLPLLCVFALACAWVCAQLVVGALRHACTGLEALIFCGGKGGSGRRRRAWDLSTPTYLQSLAPQPPAGLRAGSPAQSQAMQGRESYNMLLDPEIMHVFGINEAWARSHKRQCPLPALRPRALCLPPPPFPPFPNPFTPTGRPHALPLPSFFSLSLSLSLSRARAMHGKAEADLSSLPRSGLGPPSPSSAPPWAAGDFTANPLGPLAGAPPLSSAAAAAAFAEEDALELDCEGEEYGMPASYCVSARRLGVAPEGVALYAAYNRPAGRPPGGPAPLGTQV